MQAHLKSLILLIAAGSLLVAGSVEVEAPLYSLNAESVSYELVDAPSGDYYLLLFNNLESVVLDGNSLEAIEDEAILQEVIDAYQSSQFDSLGFDVKLLEVQAAFNEVHEVVDYCASGVGFFVSHNSGLKIYIVMAPTAYPRSSVALDNFEEHHPIINESLYAMNASMTSLNAAGNTRNLDKVVAALETITTHVDSVDEQYDILAFNAQEIYDETNANEYYFLWVQGNARDCTRGAELDTKIAALEAAASPGDFETSDELMERITSETSERLPIALQLKAAAENFDRYMELKVLIDTLVEDYSGLDASVPALNDQGDLFEEAFNALNNTQANGTVEEREAEFDELFNELSVLADGYNAAFESFSKAKTAVGNASVQLNVVSEKYGGTDERIVELKATVQQLNSRVNAQSQELANGEYEVTVELDSIAVNASGIAAVVYQMQPRENELDLVTIGGVIVLLLTLVGAFVYFKKYKEDGGFGMQPPEAKEDSGSSSSPGALVGRDNPDYQNPSNPYK